MKPIEKEFNCLGHYGFGGGVGIQRGNLNQELYCSAKCPEAQRCWERHKEIVAGLYPDLTAEFEKRAQVKQGPALMKEWVGEFKIADPYTMVMGGNIEDGSRVSAGWTPKDRGPGTLVYPFRVN
jgi:hypothetical protein